MNFPCSQTSVQAQFLLDPVGLICPPFLLIAKLQPRWPPVHGPSEHPHTVRSGPLPGAAPPAQPRRGTEAGGCVAAVTRYAGPPPGTRVAAGEREVRQLSGSGGGAATWESGLRSPPRVFFRPPSLTIWPRVVGRRVAPLWTSHPLSLQPLPTRVSAVHRDPSSSPVIQFPAKPGRPRMPKCPR